MFYSENSTGAASAASHHPIDVISNAASELICLTAMIDFACTAAGESIGFRTATRDLKRENDVIVALLDIARRTRELDVALKAALARHDGEGRANG